MAGTAQGIAPTMRAIRLQTPGGPGELVLERIETPHPREGEALVRVHAAAITRDELEWPVDRLPATPSYELSGEVAALAPDVNTVTIGEPVWALTGFDRDGAAAEYIVVAAALLAPKPRTLDHEESAAVPLAALSAWQGLFHHGGLEEGERVLIHGAAGGVGHFATQLARHQPGGEARIGRRRATGDPPGAEDRSDVLRRRAQPRAARRASHMIGAGDLRPAIDSVFPLSDARAAFERSLASGKRGKVILRVVGGVAHD